MNSRGQRRLAVVGAADHAGWANLVTVGVSGADGEPRGGLDPVLMDRRRCTLLDAALPRQPYHAAEGLPAADAEALVARVSAAAEEGARAALATVVEDVSRRDRATGWSVVALTLRAGGRRPLPDTVAGVLASHAAMHAAEGQLYRDALADAAAGLGLDVVVHSRGDAIAEAAAALRTDADAVAELVAGLGRTAGPPWQKEHRHAAAAALAELARRTRVEADGGRAP